jgi:hypothetical protein
MDERRSDLTTLLPLQCGDYKEQCLPSTNILGVLSHHGLPTVFRSVVFLDTHTLSMYNFVKKKKEVKL